MSEELYAIAPARRRRMALVLAPLGLALLVAAILGITLDGVGWKLAGLLVAVLAVALLGVAWGLQRSVALSEAAEAERRLDEVLVAAAHSSGLTCGSAGSRPDTSAASTNREASAGAEGATGAEDATGAEASAGAEGATGAEDATGTDSATCGSAGLVCGSGRAESGCGASCLARTR